MNFDYGDILTRAFKLTWRHKSFWLFMMLPMLVASIIFLAIAASLLLLEGDEDMAGAVMGSFFCLFFPALALYSGIVGAFTTSAVDIACLQLSRPVENEAVFASKTSP